MKRFITGIFAATLLATSPSWAHGGGRGHGDHDERHGGKHLKHKHKHRHDDDVVVIRERQIVQPRVVERVTVLEPQPVVVQEPPVNIVIPLR